MKAVNQNFFLYFMTFFSLTTLIRYLDSYPGMKFWLALIGFLGFSAMMLISFRKA